MKARNISLLTAIIIPMALSCSTTNPGGTGLKCRFSPESYNFGNVVVDDYVNLEVTLGTAVTHNSHIEGTARIDCPGFAFYLPGSSDPVDSFEYNLDYPEELVFWIRFEPPAVGAYNCEVAFDSDCGTMTLVGGGIETVEDTWEQLSQTTGNDLHDICMDSSGFGLVVGDSGTVLIKYSINENFNLWDSYDFEDIKLNAVWILEGDIFYAAGGEISSDPGYIYKFDSYWGILDTDHMMEYYSSIWGAADCDIHFGGVNVMSMGGWNVKRYDCADFSTFEVDMGMSEVSGISGSSSTNVWAVLKHSGERHIYHFDGTGWSQKGEAWMSAILHDVWVSDDGEVFIVGSNGAIYNFDGVNWNQGSLGGFSGTFYGVWGTAADDVYAVGSSAAIYHFDGNEWSAQYGPPGLTQDLYSVWGSGSSDVWAVGQDGVILHHD